VRSPATATIRSFRPTPIDAAPTLGTTAVDIPSAMLGIPSPMLGIPSPMLGIPSPMLGIPSGFRAVALRHDRHEFLTFSPQLRCKLLCVYSLRRIPWTKSVSRASYIAC
jgi:hypothetical protein